MSEHTVVHFPAIVKRHLAVQRQYRKPVTETTSAIGSLYEHWHTAMACINTREITIGKEERLQALADLAAACQRIAEDMKLLPWPNSDRLTVRHD